MLENIADILHRECKISARNHLLVGVSGGPDSLCLLHILHKLNFPITAVHVNHLLRAEANEDANLVVDYTARLGVDCIVQQVDVRGYARIHSMTLEEAARALRYQALFEQAKTLHADAVAVGHTADDQVETILMHLLRGSGLAGLRGMEYCVAPNPWSNDIPLIRPLLSTWRVEIEGYLDHYQMKPATDQSNLETTYTRNRIRLELLPTLQGYNPQVREALLRMAESLKEDYAVLQELTSQAWSTSLVHQEEGILGFDWDQLAALPPAIQRHLLRKAIAFHLPGLVDVGSDCIERGLSLLAGKKTSGQTDLIAGLRLIKEGGRIWLIDRKLDLPSENYPRISTIDETQILIPSATRMSDGWILEVEEISTPSMDFIQERSSVDPYQAWMDLSQLTQPLLLRRRRPGDRIHPLGMGKHTMKIADLMINLKLPVRKRSGWPLICAGDEVLWVPGYQLSERVRMQLNSRNAIHLRLFRERGA